MITVVFCVIIQHFAEIGQSVAEAKKWRFTMWRSPAIFNLKVWGFGRRVIVTVLVCFSTQNLMKIKFLKIFTFACHCSLILHIRTKFPGKSDNPLPICRRNDVLQYVVHPLSCTVCTVFKKSNFGQIVLS